MKIATYHYTECGLDYIYLINGFEITKNGKEKEIFIHDIHGLHKSIGKILLDKPGLLAGEEIKFIRTMMDLTQHRLAKMLGCTYQTILLWEKGRQKIQLLPNIVIKALFYEFLYPHQNTKIHDLIKELSELDAKQDADNYTKIRLKEESNKWTKVA